MVSANAFAPREEDRAREHGQHLPDEADVARWAEPFEALPEGLRAGIDEIGREISDISRRR